jgi:ATP-dependent DNA helicase
LRTLRRVVLTRASVSVKAVNNLSLQNAIMQLRKACAHPFLFFWPRDPETLEEIVGKELVRSSGKMMLLDRLLEALIGRNAKIDKKTKRPHKVLLFSQFTRMLDIIEVHRRYRRRVAYDTCLHRCYRTGRTIKKDG